MLKKVVVDIFIFILCDMIVYVGIFKEEIQHQSTKLFWHGMVAWYRYGYWLCLCIFQRIRESVAIDGVVHLAGEIILYFGH